MNFEREAEVEDPRLLAGELQHVEAVPFDADLEYAVSDHESLQLYLQAKLSEIFTKELSLFRGKFIVLPPVELCDLLSGFVSALLILGVCAVVLFAFWVLF